MSNYVGHIIRKEDGVYSSCLMLDDYFGPHRYGIAVPKDYPMTDSDIWAQSFSELRRTFDIYPVDDKDKENRKRYREFQKKFELT